MGSFTPIPDSGAGAKRPRPENDDASGAELSLRLGVRLVFVLPLAALAGGARFAMAQIAGSTPVFSMGQPSRWLPYVSASGLAGDRAGVGASFGISHAVLNPVTGLFALRGETYGEWRPSEVGAGARALASAPVIGLSAGADWRATTGGVDPIFSFQTAVRRGGLFGGGSMLRVDWLPTRSEVGVGVTVPLHQPFAGRTRPRATMATAAPRRGGGANGRKHAASGAAATEGATHLPPDAEHALRDADRTAELICAFTNLYTSGDQAMLAADATRRGYAAAMTSYHAALVTAFAAALHDDASARTVSTRARAVVLNTSILPFDALFGQNKSERLVSELFASSRAGFARWLVDSSTVAPADRPAVLGIFDRWTSSLTALAHQLRARWRDWRLVWLPAQLALSPDQFDDQRELDDLVGRAVGHAFSHSNEVAYLRTADLPLEIARSIMAARRYHVLWAHDFTGRRPSKQLDEISFTIVADAYLPALTAAVERYDTTGVIPQYIILLDAFYYHARYGRMWMTLLERPLTASNPLGAHEEAQAQHLQERLDALRDAVAHSARLQREAAAHGGAAWLESVVKVNVNIVLPSDFSFRSARMLPPLPFTPDNVSRDHRKMVLYDFTEADPYAGELLVTGVGIGEHYASATWEDRGYRVRGPGALEARAAVRRALTANGFTADEMPASLRATAPVRADPSRAGAPHGARVLNVDNEPGFGAKRSSVARAMLYTLAPPGSDIVVPDPLWLSESWAGMLLGAAARGCQVAIITPAVPNSPNPEKEVIALQHDILEGILAIRNRFRERIGDAGGAFHIGIYASRTPVTDPRARFAETRAGLAQYPWIREMIPLDSAALASIDHATMTAERTAAGAILAEDERPREPQLHQKTQLIARPGAIAALVRQPGWESTLATTLLAQSQETARLAEELSAPAPAADTAAVHATDRLLQSYERSLSPEERTRLSFYFVVGTQNHDSRGLLMDGEASLVVSGFEASVGLVDLFYLMARTTWVDRSAEIDHLVPVERGLTTKLMRIFRLAM